MTTRNAPYTPPTQVITPTQPVQEPSNLGREKSPKYRSHHQPLIPGLPYNPVVDRYVSSATEGFKTPSQSTSDIIRHALKSRWGKDIDPDNTFITSFNYDPKLPKPRGGKVLNQISLTDAAMQNMRHKNKKDEHQTPDEKAQSTLHSWINKLAPLAAAPIAIYNIVHKINEPKTYEGIFTGPQHGGRQLYNATTQLRQTPATFRDIVWNTEQIKPYTEFLNGFWPAHEQKYAQLSKAAFVGAAMAQFDNDSLSESDVSLAMRAAGLPTDKTWANMSLNDLDPAPQKDPNVETGLLKINGFKSTDLMYITDKQTKTTLLHIPGNSSPIHRFDSQEQMKNWLAEQAADPKKREALSMHFPLRDQADRVFSEGVNQTLVGISGWPKKDAPGASALERLNEYNPQTFITTEPLTDDPFRAMTARQKERSYADAETQITTDGDVTKTTILEALETTTKVAVMMTPLALVMPEVAIGLEVFYATAGAAQIGIGADNIRHGKQGGADQVVFGVLNALPVVVSGASKVIEGASEAAVSESVEEAAQRPAEKPVEQRVSVEADANRIQPTQSANISAHAVPDGEQLIEGATRNSKGMYQVKGSSGADRWFIRYTDMTGQPKVYEIRSDFKLRDDYVQIIDPETRKPVMTVHSTADGEWGRGIGPGGARKWPWKRTPSPTPSNELKEQSRFADKFVGEDGTKLKGAEKLDEYLQVDAPIDYKLSNKYIADGDGVKNRLSASWMIKEDNYAPTPGEKAVPTEYGSSEYSPSFVTDAPRIRYTIVVKGPDGETSTVLASTAQSEAERKADIIKQFESLVPDPFIRARISEVAHQGALADMINYMSGDATGLQKGYMARHGSAEITIEYEPVLNKAQVKVHSTNSFVRTSDEIIPVTDAEISTSRTFNIGLNNELADLDGLYVVDKHAPSHVELSVDIPM